MLPRSGQARECPEACNNLAQLLLGPFFRRGCAVRGPLAHWGSPVRLRDPLRSIPTIDPPPLRSAPTIGVPPLPDDRGDVPLRRSLGGVAIGGCTIGGLCDRSRPGTPAALHVRTKHERFRGVELCEYCITPVLTLRGPLGGGSRGRHDHTPHPRKTSQGRAGEGAKKPYCDRRLSTPCAPIRKGMHWR